MKTGPYKELFQNRFIVQDKFRPNIFQYIPTKHSLKTVFHQQIKKRNLRKQKISEEKALPNQIQIEICANKYLTTQFLRKSRTDISTK